MTLNKQIVLDRKPSGKLTVDCFRTQSSPVGDPGPGEVLCRTLLLSLDPANRAWMQGATYRGEVHAGTVMPGFTLAEVVASNDIKFKAGDLVEGDGGWQQYFVSPAKGLQKRVRLEPLSHLMSVLGVTGKTAYCGLLDIGKPQPGETVVVSAAAGATGSIAAQIAKIKGAYVVGIAGGPEKCRWLVDELGLDDAIDHREGNVYATLKARCPKGVDVYFDNTGGPILEAVLSRMNLNGRIVCCGVVSQYDTANPASGPRGIPGLLVTKRIKMQGFIVMDYVKLLPQAEKDLAKWMAEGKLKVAEDIIDGLDQAPAGLVGLLAGENRGKRMIRVAD
ncbi:MAG TPA: NADP-dependent oxidoreductase [Pseudomonadales bacterium]|nr:NADP-dependent oxidoreductase [Pseudomonadales bacterium]